MDVKIIKLKNLNVYNGIKIDKNIITIIDMKEVDVCSALIANLLEHKDVIILINVKDKLINILEYLGIINHFKIADSISNAVKILTN